MKKIILTAVLVLSSTAVFAGPNCDVYLKEVDIMVDNAREYMSADELKEVDTQMTQMKTMLGSIPEAEREVGCTQALEQLPMMKEMLKQAIEQKRANG